MATSALGQRADVDSPGSRENVPDPVEPPVNGAHGPTASNDVTEKGDSTIVAKINPRTNDGYRIQLVARLVSESPNPLVRRAKKILPIQIDIALA